MKVLIADDERFVRFAMRLALAEAGHDVLEAADGEEAAEAILEHSPDALVLDLVMPRWTGYDVLRWLSDQPRFSQLPVVILSAFVADAETFERDSKVVAVLQKPLYIDQLFEALLACERRLVA